MGLEVQCDQKSTRALMLGVHWKEGVSTTDLDTFRTLFEETRERVFNPLTSRRVANRGNLTGFARVTKARDVIDGFASILVTEDAVDIFAAGSLAVTVKSQKSSDRYNQSFEYAIPVQVRQFREELAIQMATSASKHSQPQVLLRVGNCALGPSFQG